MNCEIGKAAVRHEGDEIGVLANAGDDVQEIPPTTGSLYRPMEIDTQLRVRVLEISPSPTLRAFTLLPCGYVNLATMSTES